MRRVLPLILVLLAFAAGASAQTPHALYPDDYTVSPCAEAATVCQSFTDAEMPSVAMKFLGLSLDPRWVEKHGAEMRVDFAPLCRKLATCYASQATTFLFCDDIVAAEFRAICGRKFPKDQSVSDFENCGAFVEAYYLGVDQHGGKPWDQAQACAKEKGLVTEGRTFDWWMTPYPIPGPDFNGPITFFTIDHETHVPMMAEVRVQDQTIFTNTNPSGTPASIYSFKLPIQLRRVPNAQGHSDVVVPNVTLTAPGYQTVTMPLPVTLGTMQLTVTPAVAQWKRGKNKVTIRATDSVTGKPIEARIMAGELVAGETNQPFEITFPKNGSRPEIWVTSLFNLYSDAVIAPAVKK